MRILSSTLLVVVAAAAWAGARHWVFPRAAPPPVEDRPVETLQDGYVSSRACAACHPGQHASWQRSYHRTMTQVAAPQSVLAPFAGEELEFRGETFQLSRRGDEFWVRRTADGAEPVQSRIVMTTGSHHFQCYWTASGSSRRVDQLPFCYQIAERRWIEFFALVLVDPDVAARGELEAPWNDNCARCHSVAPRPGVRGPDEMETHVAELGIACEACHGPGAEHVTAHRNPTRRYAQHFSDQPDPTIVNPARLSQARSTEVCGQCHSVSRFQPEVDWSRDGSGFIPGRDLSTRIRLVHQDGLGLLRPDTRFWPDGMIRPNGREYNSLLRSPCWKGGELTCLSCHSMHQAVADRRPWQEWANDQLTPGREANGGCTQCHGELADPARLAGHTHHGLESSGSECYNCHMPNTAYGLQKATRSHEITNPSVIESTGVGRPNACNLCHLDQTLAWTSRHLTAWYGTKPVRLDGDEAVFAAGPLWALRGDAAQRALTAWSMGWAPARRASGEDWIGLYLASLLDDRYAAIRSIAFRGLATLDGFAGFEYDWFANQQDLRRSSERALRIWSALRDRQSRGMRLLIAADGTARTDLMRRLEARRDDRPILITE